LRPPIDVSRVFADFVGNFCLQTNPSNCHWQKQLKKLKTSFDFKTMTREHWKGEMSADEWVPVFPVFNWPLVLWKKYFVIIKMTYSSRYSFCSLQFPVRLVFPTMTNDIFSRQCTGIPCYLRSLYLQICLFSNVKLVKKKDKMSTQNVSFYMRIKWSRSKIAFAVQISLRGPK